MSQNAGVAERKSLDDRFEVCISSRFDAAVNIVVLDLVATDGGKLPAFEGGSHVDVVVAPGIVRQYSLCNDPGERYRYRLGILRDPTSRGGSEGVHRTFTAGQRISISRPRCNFHLVAGDGVAILIAGGIGITPILSMAFALHTRGSPFVLHYCTRSRDRSAFVEELAAAPFAPVVQMHYDDGPDLQSFSLDTALCGKAPDAQLYICGPEGFIGYVTGGATDRGWPTERVHVEHFNSEVTQDGDAFLVKAILSGVTVRVPSGVSIAKVLMDAGVNIPISCEQGICGSCLTPVREGLPDHRDYYQTDQEKAANTHMTPCCSRSLSPSLTLNL